MTVAISIIIAWNVNFGSQTEKLFYDIELANVEALAKSEVGDGLIPQHATMLLIIDGVITGYDTDYCDLQKTQCIVWW